MRQNLLSLFLFFWNVCSRSVTVTLTNTRPHSWLHVWVHTWSLTYHCKNLTCHSLKPSAFCFHHGRGDTSNLFLSEEIVVTRTLTYRYHCLYSSHVLQTIGCLHIQQLLRNGGAASPDRCKNNIYSLLAQLPSFKDSGSCAPSVKSILPHLPGAWR